MNPDTSCGAVCTPCAHCGGSGRVELTGEYLATYRALAALGAEVSGAVLARRMGVRATAMNNRLAALERHGLAVSRRYGRERRFRVHGETTVGLSGGEE